MSPSGACGYCGGFGHARSACQSPKTKLARTQAVLAELDADEQQFMSRYKGAGDVVKYFASRRAELRRQRDGLRRQVGA